MSPNNKTKLLGGVIGVVLFIVLIAGITYAWVTWQSDNTILSGKTGCFPDIYYYTDDSFSTFGDYNNGVLLYDESEILRGNTFLVKEGMPYIALIVNEISSDCNLDVGLNLELNVTELGSAFINGSSVGALKYVLVSYKIVYSPSVSLQYGKYLEILDRGSISNTGIINIDGGKITTDSMMYVVIFYIDGDMAFNDAQNSEFSVNINGKVVQMGN